MQLFRMPWGAWLEIKAEAIRRDNFLEMLKAKVPRGYVLVDEEPTGWNMGKWNDLAPHTHAIWKVARK